MVADTKKTGSKSSSKAKGQKPRVTKAETEAPAAEETEAPQAEETPAAPAAAALKPVEPTFSAEDWFNNSKRQLGVPPWILKAALAGEPADRKYTRNEIDKFVRAALNTPA